MTTAQTVQLLDANNNNISPAVCIDSIYYEGTKSTGTYRFALREKFMVGGNLDEGSPKLPSVQRNELHIPYLFAEKGMESVYKISSSTFNIAGLVEDYIDTVYKQTYASIDYVDTNFLDINGSNSMLGPVKLNDSSVNTVLKLSTVGLDDSTNSNSIHIIDGSVTIVAEDRITLSTDNEIEIGRTASHIYLGGNIDTTDISIYGNNVEMYGEEELILQSNHKSVLINGEQGIFLDSSTGPIELNAGNREQDITLDASNIYINGIRFVPPENGDVKRMLAVTQVDEKVQMTWNDIGGMRALNYNTPDNSTEFSFIDTAENNILSGACISFAGENGRDYVTIGDDTVSAINIASIAGKTLDGSHNIEVMTINGKPVVGTSEPLTLVLDSSFEEYKKNLVHFTASTYNGNNLLVISKNDSNEYVISENSAVTVNGGNLFAKAFIMQSDRNMKTDFREDCFALEMPPIHGFKWKDSSIQSYGFIAQELEEAGFEHLVTERDGIKGVDYMAALSYKVAQLERENKMLAQSLVNLYEKLNIK